MVGARGGGGTKRQESGGGKKTYKKKKNHHGFTRWTTVFSFLLSERPSHGIASHFLNYIYIYPGLHKERLRSFWTFGIAWMVHTGTGSGIIMITYHQHHCCTFTHGPWWDSFFVLLYHRGKHRLIAPRLLDGLLRTKAEELTTVITTHQNFIISKQKMARTSVHLARISLIASHIMIVMPTP